MYMYIKQLVLIGAVAVAECQMRSRTGSIRKNLGGGGGGGGGGGDLRDPVYSSLIFY